MPAQKFNGLDHLRALAILLVFVYHYQLYVFGHPAWVQFFDGIGWSGVDLFFILSGFLIANQLFTVIQQDQKVNVGQFYLKRFFRIIPLYWFIVAIYFCFPFVREKESLPPLWRFLSFTQNFGLDLVNKGTFSHAWSLCVEEHFYFLLPLVLWLLYRVRLFRNSYWVLIALFAGVVALRIYSWYDLFLKAGSGAAWAKYIYYPTYCRLDGLLIGVSIAAIFRFKPGAWGYIARFANYIIVAGVLLLVVDFAFFGQLGSYEVTMIGFPLTAIGFGCIVTGAVSSGSFLYKTPSRITGFIATISYALYLSHKMVIHTVQELFAGAGIARDSNWMMLLCVCFCIIIAYLLYLLIEKPFIGIRKRL